MIDIRVTREILSMAGLAVATAIIIGRAACRHGGSTTIGRLQRAIIIVAGDAGVMHFRIGGIKRGTGSGTSRSTMAKNTIVVLVDHRGVVGGQLANCIGMTLRTGTSSGIAMGRGMMNGPGGQSEFGYVTTHTGRGISGTNRAAIDTVGRVAIFSGTATLRFHMAHTARISMDCRNNINSGGGRSWVMTSCAISIPTKTCLGMTVFLKAGCMLMTGCTIDSDPIFMTISAPRKIPGFGEMTGLRMTHLADASSCSTCFNETGGWVEKFNRFCVRNNNWMKRISPIRVGNFFFDQLPVNETKGVAGGRILYMGQWIRIRCGDCLDWKQSANHYLGICC